MNIEPSHPDDSAGWISGPMGTDEETAQHVPDGVDGHPIGTRRARCLHCGQAVAIVGARYTLHNRPQGDHCRDPGRPVQTP